jgi:phosphoribosylglycinamide formyltransferase 2
VFSGFEEALSHPRTALRLFGKPEVNGKRRMGVVIARGDSIEEARTIATNAANSIKVEL